MKTLSLTSFIILFILIPAIHAQVEYTKIYKGRVKLVTELYFQMHERPGGLDTVSEGKLIMKFDTHGKISEQFKYTKSGKSFRKIVPYYDENGVAVEEREYVKDTLKLRTVPEYNIRGEIITQRIYRPDSTFNFRITYSYDDKGRLEEKNYFDKKGKRYLRNTYRYDKDGNLTRQNSYRGDGSLISSNNIIYDNYDKTGNWQRSFVMGNEDRPGFLTIRTIEYYK